MNVLLFVFCGAAAFFAGLTLGALGIGRHGPKSSSKGAVSGEISQEYRNFLEYDGSEQS